MIEVDEMAKVLAQELLRQNPCLKLDDDGCGLYDADDNKHYDCRGMAIAALMLVEYPNGNWTRLCIHDAR